MERIVQATVWIYGKLLLVYPNELRTRFSTDMVEVFEDFLRDAAEQRGAAGIAEMWRTAFVELATLGLAARLKANVIIAGGLSFVVSSLITWVFLHAVG
jgi:hypothetical protein